MSALAGLVDKGLMAPDWAEALAPVEDRIERMGQFLRDELAAGRKYLPAGDNVFHAFRRPLAGVRVLVVGQDPYPTPGHPVGLSSPQASLGCPDRWDDQAGQGEGDACGRAATRRLVARRP